jgi:hypothetical protein
VIVKPRAPESSGSANLSIQETRSSGFELVQLFLECCFTKQKKQVYVIRHDNPAKIFCI